MEINIAINGQICVILAMLLPFLVAYWTNGFIRASSAAPVALYTLSLSLVPRAEPAVISPQANDYVKTTTLLRKASITALSAEQATDWTIKPRGENQPQKDHC